MGGLFYLAGVALAAFAGYSNAPWYLIFIASFIMAIGYFIIRAPQIHTITAGQGALAVPKLMLIQIIVYSIITAPIYFVATLFYDEIVYEGALK